MSKKQHVIDRIAPGSIAEELELFGVFSGESMRHVYPNGDEVSNIDIVYLCRKYHGELLCQEGEVEKLAFFPVEELPEPLFAPHRGTFEKLREKLKK